MGRVGRFILKVAAVLILIVSAGTFALSLFTGETRNGDNLQSEFDYLITVGISQSGEESHGRMQIQRLLWIHLSNQTAMKRCMQMQVAIRKNRLKMWKDL